MQVKKISIVLIVVGVLIALLLMYYNQQITNHAKSEGCFTGDMCEDFENTMSIFHIGIGIFSFIIALGFYLFFFSKSDALMKERMRKESEEELKKEKIEFLLKFLDSYEADVIKALRENEGIAQSALRWKVDMSKAKLSYILKDLEKRGLIKRVQKGKTLLVYLKI